ncbi:CLUMA_CG017503, isoform A [Clunio marinus]|uniref:CLUMA_CG017503, isoform A n=1 Tax=Clunio marinus TaxID=568069 RepID=A0A1J1J0P2_9DIPT|nr:CLUMA_CG017503, isoform A [Clunio marinus]
MTSNISFNDTFNVVKFQEEILRNKCRLCLKPVNSETDRTQLSKEFKHMIHNILQIQLNSSSITSNFICQICRSQVNDFYLFKSEMIEQQNYLEKFLVVDYLITYLDETDFNTDLSTTLNETEINDSMLLENSKKYGKLIERLKESLAGSDSTIYFDETDLSTDLSTSTILKPNKKSISNIELEDSLMGIKIETNRSKNMDEEKEIGDAQKIPCKTCGRLLKRGSLKAHILRIHKLEKKRCEICGKVIRSRFALKKHMKEVHDKPFECDFCGKNFSSKDAVQEHLMLHVPKKFQIKHKCLFCGMFYRRRSSFNYHLSTHKEKPFQCYYPGCTKTFHKKSNMEEHYRTHCEGRKVLKCPYENCNTTYLYKHSLTFHISSIHKGIRINCPIGSGCKYSGPHKNHIKAHLLRMHKNLSREVLEDYISQINVMKSLI